MKTIGVFRNQLFKNSEPFIQNQADSITRFNVVYFGRRVANNNYGERIVRTINTNNNLKDRMSEIKNVLTMDSRSYLEAFKKAGTDLVHAHFAIDSLYALKATKGMGIPLVTTLHGFDVTTRKIDFIKSRSPSWINYAIFSKELKKHSDLFLCVSDFIRNKALERGFPESKLVTHYIGIDTNSYTTSFIEEKNNEKIILHIARLVEKKGTTYIIDAINKIKSKLDGYKVKIVGGGPLYKTLVNKVECLNLKEHIEMLGEIPHHDVMQLVKDASMLLVPSVTAKSGDSEGLPTVILEASSCNVPVIGTYHAGIPEAIIDEKTGLLVQEKNIDELAERILFLIENESIRAEMGRNARDLMCEKFNLSRQTALLENYYEGILNGR